VTETDALHPDEVAELRQQMTTNQFSREFLCSFDAPVEGSYFGDKIVEAETEGRICQVPYDPAAGVLTSWDLGLADKTAIWFVQRIGRELHVIDYLENSGKALDWYAKQLDLKRYQYVGHIFPHDVRARELGTGRSRYEVLEGLQLEPSICPQHKVEDGIAAVRTILPICWFDAEKCAEGLSALKGYRAAPAPSLGTMHQRPLHDWSSHGADSFRYMAMGMDRVIGWANRTKGGRSFKNFRVPNLARRA
jgi:hypothetical protein